MICPFSSTSQEQRCHCWREGQSWLFCWQLCSNSPCRNTAQNLRTPQNWPNIPRLVQQSTKEVVGIQTLVFSCAGAESTGRAVPRGERLGQPLAREQSSALTALEEGRGWGAWQGKVNQRECLGREQRNSDCTQCHPRAPAQGCCSWHAGRREQEGKAAEGRSCYSQLSVVWEGLGQPIPHPVCFSLLFL